MLNSDQRSYASAGLTLVEVKKQGQEQLAESAQIHLKLLNDDYNFHHCPCG